jgi:hypothetical protein
MYDVNELWGLVRGTDKELQKEGIKELTKLGYNVSLPEMFRHAIETNTPFSWVRLGDGELVILSQLIWSSDYILGKYGWSASLGYCGVSVPSMDFCNRMVEGIKNASLVGVFATDPFYVQISDAMNYQPKYTTFAFDNIYLPMRKDFVDLIRKYPPLIIGRHSKSYALKLKELINVDIKHCISINNYHEVDQVIQQAVSVSDDWKWALVCAGASAVVIAAELGYKYNKVALDFGHGFDNAFATPPNWTEYWLTTE